MQKAKNDRSMRRNNELYKYSGRFKQASFNTVENMMEKSTSYDHKIQENRYY